MSFFIGVDGGGTKTRAVLVDREGHELGRAVADGAVATARDPSAAARAVARAVRDAVEAAGLELPGAVLWAGLAGAGPREAREGVKKALTRLRLADQVHVGTDVEAAFHDAFPQGPGVLLIAGTGSIAWTRLADGVTHRVGGWGQHIGDEGSGFALGVAGLRLVTQAADGRAGETRLSVDLVDACGVSSAEDLIAWVGGADKGQVAALAPVVVAAADAGDVGAEAIVARAVEALVAHVAAAGTLLAGERPDVVLWGGLVADGGPLRGRVTAALQGAGWGVEGRTLDPVRGAAHLALESRSRG